MGRNTHFCTVPGSPSLNDTLAMCLGNSDLTICSLRKQLVLENHHTPSQRLPVFRYFLHLLKRRGDPCQCWARDSCAHTPSKAHPVSSAKSRASQSVFLGPAASPSVGLLVEMQIFRPCSRCAEWEAVCSQAVRLICMWHSEQHCPAELCVMMEMSYSCTVHYGSHLSTWNVTEDVKF